MASGDDEYPAIPEQFAEWADQIRATMKKTIRFTLKPNSNLEKWQSKVGGTPYLPLEHEYPLNCDGKPLLFLAQINFSETPYVDYLPKEGIVAFYIDSHDEMYGLRNNGFKVLYFKDVKKNDSLLHEGAPDAASIPLGPFEKKICFSMDFTVENQYISSSDHRWQKIFKGEEMFLEYRDTFTAIGHRIGGYAYFSEDDPRDGTDDFDDYELLFQCDTDDGIAWGDVGHGSFFIDQQDLANLDFSNVLYNWDC